MCACPTWGRLTQQYWASSSISEYKSNKRPTSTPKLVTLSFTVQPRQSPVIQEHQRHVCATPLPSPSDPPDFNIVNHNSSTQDQLVKKFTNQVLLRGLRFKCYPSM